LAYSLCGLPAFQLQFPAETSCTAFFSFKDKKGAITLPCQSLGAQALQAGGLLVDHFRDDTSAYGAATFADRETQTIVHRNRADQLDDHLNIVARHHHLNTFR